jgi:predicted secreted Zn-dependent protease
VTEEWGKRLAQLEKHEGEHERIGRKASQDIYDALVQLAPAPSCGELEKEIETRAQAVIAKSRETNDELDRVTDHGRRLGEAAP